MLSVQQAVAKVGSRQAVGWQAIQLDLSRTDGATERDGFTGGGAVGKPG